MSGVDRPTEEAVTAAISEWFGRDVPRDTWGKAFRDAERMLTAAYAIDSPPAVHTERLEAENEKLKRVLTDLLSAVSFDGDQFRIESETSLIRARSALSPGSEKAT